MTRDIELSMMVVVTIRNKHILCIAKCKTIPWLFFKFRGSNRHIRPTGKHIADGDGVMPTPLDEFPPIPENDGSGNESHEQTNLKENTPPAAAAGQSVKRLSDRAPSFERKNTAKHSTAERKCSNKLQRKGTLRRQVRWLHSHHLTNRAV